MIPKRGRDARSKDGKQKIVPRSTEEYERLMQRPPDVEDALEFEETIQEEFGEDAVESEPPEGPG